MIKTVTLSALRIDSIKNQFSYELKLLGDMKMERVALFLKEIEAKNIEEISFHGLKGNSYVSEEDIFISIDWEKHSELIRRGEQYVKTDKTFEDGAAPETIIECYTFKENCDKKGLRIEMRVTYSSWVRSDRATVDRLNSILGLRRVREDETIEYSGANGYRSNIRVNSLEEMSIKRYSN